MPIKSLHIQVALNRFIDDVSTLAIENCLIGKIPELFRSSHIVNMSPDDISRLAGEAAESSVERKRLSEKREILNTGLQELGGLKKQRLFAGPAEWNSREVKSEPDKTVYTLTKTPSTASVTEASSVVGSENKAIPSIDEDFEVFSAPRAASWRANSQRVRERARIFGTPSRYEPEE